MAEVDCSGSRRKPVVRLTPTFSSGQSTAKSLVVDHQSLVIGRWSLAKIPWPSALGFVVKAGHRNGQRPKTEGQRLLHIHKRRPTRDRCRLPSN